MVSSPREKNKDLLTLPLPSFPYPKEGLMAYNDALILISIEMAFTVLLQELVIPAEVFGSIPQLVLFAMQHACNT